jgi:hypothetical protein
VRETGHVVADHPGEDKVLGDGERDEDPGGDIEDADDDEEHDAPDVGAGEEDHVGAGDRRNGSGGSERGVVLEEGVRPAGDSGPEEVERQEPGAGESVLDVGPEDPQDHHVAEKVPPAAVQEGGGP